AVANGDLSKKITVDVRGEILELKNTFNTMVDQLGSFASEVTRVAREVGTEGRLGGQAVVRGLSTQVASKGGAGAVSWRQPHCPLELGEKRLVCRNHLNPNPFRLV